MFSQKRQGPVATMRLQGPYYIWYGIGKSDSQTDAFKPLLGVLIDSFLLALLDERFTDFPARVKKAGLQFVQMLAH